MRIAQPWSGNDSNFTYTYLSVGVTGTYLDDRYHYVIRDLVGKHHSTAKANNWPSERMKYKDVKRE